MKLKVFHAFVTVWHEKGNQYNVSVYKFYAVCDSEQEAKQMIAKEVKTFRYWKHSAHLEEIKGDEKKLRELSWQGLTDKIFNKAVLAQIGVNEKENEKLCNRLEKRDYHSVTRVPIAECLENPKFFYDNVLKELTSVSKVVVTDGKFHIYEIGKKSSESLFDDELRKERDELIKEAKEEIEEVFKGILEKLNVLGT